MDCKTSDRKSYCYARKIYKRFHFPQWLHFDSENYHEPLLIKKSSGIFICSTIELFHPETNQNHWRDNIFDIIEHCPQHRFYILTKLPQNIDRPMPPNVWLGTTITDRKNEVNSLLLIEHQAKIKFLSIEPFFEPIVFSLENINWIIVGCLTEHGYKYDPRIEWIEEIIGQARRFSISVFLKNNLIPILGWEFVKEHQEWPKEKLA